MTRDSRVTLREVVHYHNTILYLAQFSIARHEEQT